MYCTIAFSPFQLSMYCKTAQIRKVKKIREKRSLEIFLKKSYNNPKKNLAHAIYAFEL